MNIFTTHRRTSTFVLLFYLQHSKHNAFCTWLLLLHRVNKLAFDHFDNACHYLHKCTGLTLMCIVSFLHKDIYIPTDIKSLKGIQQTDDRKQRAL